MTTFKGRKTAFNNSGAPTKFKGRSGLPTGAMKTPDAVANISGSNRRVTKSNVGDGGGGGTHFSSRFGKK